MEDRHRDLAIFYLVIVLAIFEAITVVILIYLCKGFRDLKKNVENYKDSLPLVKISTCTATPTSNIPNTPIGTTQKPEVNETITRVPTPDPERRSAYLERQSLSVPSTTIAMTTKNSASTTDNSPKLSFTSFNAFSRDSGICTASIRDQGSLSSTTSETLNESNTKSRDSRGSPVFAKAGMFSQEERTASNASRGYKTEPKSRASSREQTFVTSHKEFRSEQPQHGRLQTMPIEDIDVKIRGESPGNEKRYKRASKILNEMVEELDEIETKYKETSFVNDGYHGDRKPLASKESSERLSFENDQDENGNDVMEEVYVNQEVIDEERRKTLGK